MAATLWLMFVMVLVGAAVGSFLNVCIHRIPLGISVVSPASRCPQCGHPIRISDNIPLLGYWRLRGKCRDCGAKISPRYLLVELMTAFASGALFWKFGLTPACFAAFLFLCVLIVITFIDLDHQVIPHVLTLSGIPVFATLAVLFMGLRVVDCFLGITIGAALLYFVAVYYEAVTHREGMGGGDINLLAMLGGFLGWRSLLFILLCSSLLGALVGIAAMLKKGETLRYAIPFGPFLCAAAALYLFFADRLPAWLFFLRV